MKKIIRNLADLYIIAQSWYKILSLKKSLNSWLIDCWFDNLYLIDFVQDLVQVARCYE